MSSLFAVCSHIFILVVAFTGIATSQKVVTRLPGFDGQLPFYLETGYIGVGPNKESQLFYYFVESQRSPSLDPVLLWLAGGPGCSALSPFFYETGPVEFTYVNLNGSKYLDFNGSIPSLHLNIFSWTKGINIIYLDAPVGTGFSYSTTEENYYTDDYKSANDIYQFLRNWLVDHPQYFTNILYVGGDTYAGITLPMIVKKISEGNDAGEVPYMNLKGYILGNPQTDDFIDNNARIPFAHRLALISDELYEETKEACGGDYVNVDSNNTACVANIEAIDQLLIEINPTHILEPICRTAYSRPLHTSKNRRELEENIDGFLAAQDDDDDSSSWCRANNYVLAGIWANNEDVQEALGVREGTKSTWVRCNSSLAYTKIVNSSLPYQKSFTTKNLRALVFSGDHDMLIPHMGTQKWIESLNITLYDSWRAWFVEGQVAGYTEEFTNDDFVLDFATIKGAGHVPTEYEPMHCYAMIDRWMAYFYL